MLFADLFADGDNDALPADHRSESERESDWPRAGPAIRRTLPWKGRPNWRRLHHQRRHRTDQGRFRHPALAWIAGHLAAAGEMA